MEALEIVKTLEQRADELPEGYSNYMHDIIDVMKLQPELYADIDSRIGVYCSTLLSYILDLQKEIKELKSELVYVKTMVESP